MNDDTRKVWFEKRETAHDRTVWWSAIRGNDLNCASMENVTLNG